jgi:uncharacterized membrane protein
VPATLTVWKSDDPGGAERVQDKPLALQKQQLISVHDAAVVAWPADKKKPNAEQLSNLTGARRDRSLCWSWTCSLYTR